MHRQMSRHLVMLDQTWPLLTFISRLVEIRSQLMIEYSLDNVLDQSIRGLRPAIERLFKFQTKRISINVDTTLKMTPISKTVILRTRMTSLFIVHIVYKPFRCWQHTIRPIRTHNAAVTSSTYWYKRPYSRAVFNKRRGRAMASAPDCLASHACVPGSNSTCPVWGFQRHSNVSSCSMWLGDPVNGGLVELRLRPVYRR